MAKILIADDDADVRQIVSYALVEAGHEVAVAKDGEETAKKLAADPPELLVLDLMLPGLDGYDILDQMRGADIRDVTRVMILSAHSSEKDLRLTLELGADWHMAKPFDPEELVAKVDELLAMDVHELRRLRDQEHDRASLLSQLESIFDTST
ncbi:MAG TPA: response regulator transcription factor [Actinomycetota bacterium]|nr:response regulator transcription factor [Actinomycetota bacterium]